MKKKIISSFSETLTYVTRTYQFSSPFKQKTLSSLIKRENILFVCLVFIMGTLPDDGRSISRNVA